MKYESNELNINNSIVLFRISKNREAEKRIQSINSLVLVQLDFFSLVFLLHDIL